MVNFCGQMCECDPYEFVQSVIVLKDVTLCSFSLCRPCLHTLVFNDERKKNDVLSGQEKRSLTQPCSQDAIKGVFHTCDARSISVVGAKTFLIQG